MELTTLSAAEAGTIEPALRQSFDYCVVDPPFITRDVWAKYADAIRLCLKPSNGRVILTTVGENEAMLRAELGSSLGSSLRKTKFMPAMQKPWYGFGLPYQYSLYVNYELRPESALNKWNDEVPKEFAEVRRCGWFVPFEIATKSRWNGRRMR